MGRGCDFLSDQKVTKESPGVCLRGTPRGAGVPSRPTPRPPFTGDALLSDSKILPAARRQDLASFLPRGHWPLPGQKLRSVCAVRTPPTQAKPWQLGGCCGRMRHPPLQKGALKDGGRNETSAPTKGLSVLRVWAGRRRPMAPLCKGGCPRSGLGDCRFSVKFSAAVCGRILSAPTEMPFHFARRGRCPHRPGQGPGPSLAVGAAISRPSDHRCTQQEGRHQAVYGRAEMISNFGGKRPLWAENRTETGQYFARRG